MERDVRIPDWFWGILDNSRPSLQALALALEGLPRERLVEFAQHYREAAEEICPYWAGPVVDDIAFSEDDTEDLCNWVVGQGRAIWERALVLRADLEPIVRLHWAAGASESGVHAAWNAEVEKAEYRGCQAPEYIAYAVFESRFGADLHEVLQGNDGA